MDDLKIETGFQAALDAGTINGALICATDSAGSFTYNKILGERTLLSGEKKPHKSDDVLFVASATKLITTIAALQCVEDGTLSLTEDLSSFAPELAAKQVLVGFSEDGDEPILEPQTRPITLEMLLTHSSGLAYHFCDPKIGRWRQKFPPKREAGVGLSVEELISDPLSFQPGGSWMYGPSLDWAGRIVERVTGKTLNERMHERIFGPLGFDDAEFYPVTREDLRTRLVDLNPSDPEATGLAVLGGSAEMNRITKGDFGGHGLFTTIEAYSKIVHSLLANDGKILKPATVDEMFEHHLSPDATAGLGDALAGPIGPFFRVGTDTKSKTGFGLGGLLTLEDVDGWYGNRTLTWGGGLTFAWFIDRKNDLCGVCALQASLPVDGEAIANLKQVFRHDIYHKHSAWKKEESSG